MKDTLIKPLSLLVDFDAEFSRSKKKVCSVNNCTVSILFFNNKSSISIRVFQVEAGETQKKNPILILIVKMFVTCVLT